MNNFLSFHQKFPDDQKPIQAKCFHPSGTFVEFNNADIEQSIPSRFEHIVSKYPHRLAVKSANHSFTYEALNKKANRIARTILANSRDSLEPIAIYMNHDCDFVAAILGVLKANKTFVPLDPHDPNARNQSMLEDSRANLILTNTATIPYLECLATCQNIILNVDHLDLSFLGQNLDLSVSPDTVAYVMFTSGSTGKPKGVMQTHRNLLQQTLVYTNILHISPFDRLTLLHSCSNGACTPNLFGSLLNGAALYPFDVKEEGVAQLSKFLSEQKITVYHSIPVLFRTLVQSLTGTEDFSNIRILHLSGEAAANSDVELYKQHFPASCIFIHRLGSREANTVFLYLVDKNSHLHSNILPVGTPVQGKEVFLLDDRGMRVGPGEAGEIVIRSKYLSPGYWRDPERTKAKFENNFDPKDTRTFHTGDLGRLRPDGCFEHLGRNDNRVKIRGHRIEIGEVETALLNHDNIKEVAVVTRDNRHGDKELAAYVVPLREPVPTGTELRKFMELTLPSHMIPSSFLIMNCLPKLPNGKLDRIALPEPAWNRSNLQTPFVAPSTPVEQIVAEIWTEVLGLESIGVKDSFFDLGGHSLSATRIMVSVHATFQVELPWRTLFDNPTIEKLALVITEELVNFDHEEVGGKRTRCDMA